METQKIDFCCLTKKKKENCSAFPTQKKLIFQNHFIRHDFNDFCGEKSFLSEV